MADQVSRPNPPGSPKLPYMNRLRKLKQAIPSNPAGHERTPTTGRFWSKLSAGSRTSSKYTGNEPVYAPPSLHCKHCGSVVEVKVEKLALVNNLKCPVCDKAIQSDSGSAIIDLAKAIASLKQFDYGEVEVTLPDRPATAKE